MLFLLSDYMVCSRDSCIYISLTPSAKVIGLKIHPGSLGVTGVKRSFSPKLLFLIQITWYVQGSCICISLDPSTKVIGLKIHPGSLGVTGVKRSFSPKTLFLQQITWYGHVTLAYLSARYPLPN